MDQVETSVRQMRVIQAVLVLTVVLYVLVGEKVGPAQASDVRLLRDAFIAAALLNFGAAAVFRQQTVRPAVETLTRAAFAGRLEMTPQQAQVLARWRVGNIVSLVLCEAVALYGLALRFLGGIFLSAAPFYAAAILLMLVWTPRLNTSGAGPGASGPGPS